MADLEKFKRRIIRIVARRHLKEKNSEESLWNDLEKETKCDCKWLWERMRTLTLKKLKRLIIADDRNDYVTSIARMSLTDWLLYDLHLAHEKIDVIGAEFMGEKKVEPRPLFELFSLVQRFELEGLTGDGLTAAWTAATHYYNSSGRQCSPMLLQQRWYQMKEATRNKFYKFWYTYRGNLRWLQMALNDSPTKLQVAIAKRYPHIITRRFLSWEDMIKKRMVISAEEFQIETTKKFEELPQSTGNNADLALLKQEIDTIDLSQIDSESDDELKAQVECGESETIPDMETANVLAGKAATPKLELDQIPTDNYFGEIETLHNIEIHMESIRTEIEDDQDQSVKKEQITENIDPKTIHERRLQAVEHRETDEYDVINDDIQLLIASKIISVFGNFYITEPAGEWSNIPNEKMPHTISANVQPQSKVLSQNMRRATSCTEIYCDNDDVNIEEDIIKTEIIDESYKRPELIKNVNLGQVSDLTFTNKEMVTFNETVPKEQGKYMYLAEEVPNGLTFHDEGIQLEDDGIVVDNDEHSVESTKSLYHTPNKLEVHSKNLSKEEAKCEIETAELDLKLLMDSMNYVKKIDEMNIFENIAICKVGYKDDDLILAQIKPNSKKRITDIMQGNLPSSCDAKNDDTMTYKIDDNLFDLKYINKDILPSVYYYDDTKIDEDLLDSISNDSDSKYVPENKKIKLSSHLLQKPRNRNYNPIMLCKNPDFNTRLKRLTVGFLSLTRNRLLLKSCKPLTIDVSKSFESKIEDKTLYLKSCSKSNHVNKENKSDDKVNERQHTISVMPSAMPAQSLIDVINTNIEDFINKQCERTRVIQKPLEKGSILCESNKVTNLPHKDTVIQIEKNMLAAKTIPIQMPAVETIKSHVRVGNDEILKNHLNDIHSQVPMKGRKESDITSGNVIYRGSIIRSNNNQLMTHEVDLTATTSKVSNNLNKRTSFKRIFDNFRRNSSQHQLNRRRPKPVGCDWILGGKYVTQTLQSYTEEYLLTVDTLNKMLNLMDESKDNPVKAMILQGNAKKLSKSKALRKHQIELQENLCEYDRRIKGDPRGPPETHMMATMPLLTPKQKKYAIENKNIAKPKANIKKARKTRKLTESETKNSEAAMKTAVTSKSTSNANTIQNIYDTIEIDDILGDVKDDASFLQTAPLPLINNMNIAEEGEFTVEADSISPNPISTNYMTPNLISIDDVTPTQVSSAINNTIIEIDDSSIDVRTADVHYFLSPDKYSISIDEYKKTIDIICVPSVVQRGRPPTTINKIKKAPDWAIRRSRGRPPKIKSEIKTSPKSVIRRGRGRPPKIKWETKNAQESIIRRGRGRPPKIKSEAKKTLESIIRRGRGPPKTENIPGKASQRYPISRVSHGRKNKYLPSVKDFLVYEKILFLSSKSISKQPNNQPIFLGRSKILLTDVPLPPIQHTNLEGIVLSQYIDQLPVSLPKGMDLVLLPNGELTCSIAPDGNLNNEQLALIPIVLSNLKEQIIGDTSLAPSLATFGPNVPDATLSQNIDVVNISDSENNPEMLESDEQFSVNENSNENVIISSSNVTQPILSGSIVQDKEEHSNAKLNENDSEKASLFENNETVKTNFKEYNNRTITYNRKDKFSAVEHKMDTISDVPRNEYDNIGSNSHNNINREKDVIAPVVNHERRKEMQEYKRAPTTKKSILSDLMEMSGIYEEDIMPQPEIDQVSKDVPTTQPIFNCTVIVDASRDSSVSNIVVDASQVAFGNTILNVPKLNPITSFAELKYAFEKSGNFFKLDLASSVLSPINIRKNEKENSSEPVEESNTFTVDLNDEPITVANKTATSRRNEVFVTENKSTLGKTLKSSSTKSLKPLKTIDYNILRGHKNIDTDNHSRLFSILKRHKLQKNIQESKKNKKELNENEHSKVDIVEYGYDSSDDEPLAKKIKRKKQPTAVCIPNRGDDVVYFYKNIPSDMAV